MFNAYKNTANETQAYEAIRLAQLNSEKGVMASSAKSCIDTALGMFNDGRFGFAHEWACESLRYSVGIFSPDYTKVWAEAGHK